MILPSQERCATIVLIEVNLPTCNHRATDSEEHQLQSTALFLLTLGQDKLGATLRQETRRHLRMWHSVRKQTRVPDSTLEDRSSSRARAHWQRPLSALLKYVPAQPRDGLQLTGDVGGRLVHIIVPEQTEPALLLLIFRTRKVHLSARERKVVGMFFFVSTNDSKAQKSCSFEFRDHYSHSRKNDLLISG